MKWIGIAVVAAVGVAVVSILYSLLLAFGGWIVGWVLWKVVPFAGTWIVEGAGLLGIEMTLSQLPVFGAVFAFVGSFFKSSLKEKS